MLALNDLYDYFVTMVCSQCAAIRHPKMVLLARSAMAIVHPDADGATSDQVKYVSYLHIASVETLTGASSR